MVAKPVASGLTHISIGVTSKSTGSLHLYVAKNLGIFQKYGIEAEIPVAASAAMVAGLTQGDLDFMGTIPGAIQGAEKGLPIRGVFVAKEHPEYLLVGDTGYTKAEQLKGKQLAGSLPGELPSLLLAKILELNGLSESDYTVISVSNDSARAALIENHRAAAGLLGLSQSLPLIDAGHPVIDSTLEKIFIPSSGLAASLDTISKRRDLTQRTVAALVEATSIIKTDKTRTVDVLVKEFKLSPDNASKLFDFMRPTYTANGRPNPKATQFQLESDAKVMGLPKVLKEEDAYDFSLLPKG